MYLLQKKGYNIIADDLIILSKDGKIYPIFKEGCVYLDGRKRKIRPDTTSKGYKINKTFFLERGSPKIKKHRRKYYQ